MDQVERLTKRCDRERAARKQAEALLEKKSLELYHLNKDLAEREETSRLILEATGDGIIIVDLKGRVEMINRAAREIFNYDETVVIGQDIEGLLNFVGSEYSFVEFVEADLKNPDFVLHEIIGISSDGTKFPVELAISKADISNRETIILSVRDLSRRRKAEAEWNSMEVQLRQAQKLESIGQLAAGIAHEINTPIQFIGDNTRFILDSFHEIERLAEVRDRMMAAINNGQLPKELITEAEQVAEDIDFAYLREEIPAAIQQSLEGIERVAEIVRAMKEFSHPGADEKTAIDINAAINSAVTVSKNEWKYHAEMDLELDSELPLIPCHPAEFNQAILNIIVNAAHAISEVVGDKGETRGIIKIATERQGNFARITISDTGCGIPEESRSRIFDPFYTTKQVGKGTGQGLAITYSSIVDKHSGTIDVESEVGKGSIFCIRLPVTG